MNSLIESAFDDLYEVIRQCDEMTPKVARRLRDAADLIPGLDRYTDELNERALYLEIEFEEIRIGQMIDPEE